MNIIDSAPAALLIIIIFSYLFQFDSLSVPLEFNSIQYGFWNDRNGGKQTFWAGSATSQHICQCGISNNCFDRTLKCNADSLAPVELIDEGRPNIKFYILLFIFRGYPY